MIEPFKNPFKNQNQVAFAVEDNFYSNFSHHILKNLKF